MQVSSPHIRAQDPALGCSQSIQDGACYVTFPLWVKIACAQRDGNVNDGFQPRSFDGTSHWTRLSSRMLVGPA